MNNKILVSIYIPLIEEKYDMFIPKNKRVKDIIIILNQMLNKQTEGSFPILNNLYLVEKQSGQVYDIEKSVKENNILNNQELILM